ncbi:energy-coupling factor transporter ATP-binding protein EcfA2 [Sedimentibacter acidaminivorans]|uniref:Energy-coupling factor transporter ATP-binding protein EcfA2 n=1 Tax=Sedimentibacter acidaminivorans TaxID=913099 RepID=A0ABS4GG69_9FIRM|nr:AAA family ATPase [Sedimentibacter acidaminivorans]MBP1926693.1 energy-coupling factor transporter ATP-binding protein EcfA2 [Sedimentibacter acidaminivorans]
MKLRSDLTFRFETLIHQVASTKNVKYSLDSGLVTDAIELFPLIFDEEHNIDDCVDEADISCEEPRRVDVNKVNLLVEQINEKLNVHITFKDDFKHNLLKFTFLNKMNERKILSVLLCGDSGIGKTEFAKIASNVMYPNEPLIKINFGNYSKQGVLNSLIGSPLGYYGSEEGGELINKISTSKSEIILIDEFEKAAPSVFNFFYELLEDGKFTDRHGVEHNLNGYITIFTSNMTEKQYQKHIPNSLKSRFDMVYNFEDIPVEDKNIYINNTTIKLVGKLKKEFGVEVDIKLITPQLNELVKYKNLRDMKREIEDIVFGEFFKYYKRADLEPV